MGEINRDYFGQNGISYWQVLSHSGLLVIWYPLPDKKKKKKNRERQRGQWNQLGLPVSQHREGKEVQRARMPPGASL